MSGIREELMLPVLCSMYLYSIKRKVFVVLENSDWRRGKGGVVRCRLNQLCSRRNT